MVLGVVKQVLIKLDAFSRGYSKCRGIFRITDSAGKPLDGVQVCYRVGESDWIPCGSSKPAPVGAKNYTQQTTVFYRIGEPVEWRLAKPGYSERIITRYTSGMGFNENRDTVMLHSYPPA